MLIKDEEKKFIVNNQMSKT